MASSGGATRLLESPGATTWTVVLEEGARFEPGPAYRTVRVHAVDGPEDLVRALRSSVRYLEAVGLEARGPERGRIAGVLTALGIPRVTSIGQLQRPTPLGTHGGVRRLLPFITWSTVEVGRSVAAKSSASRPSRRGSRQRASKPRR
jgi:hypothetical protein